MNKYQRQESRIIKYLLKFWWMADGSSYGHFKRWYRRLKREINE